ncbi:hypothetical protein EAI_02734 [Harpegnathos saltator]|uniref:Uncharacterized protein n=1 Tax=Harpegnathos saltator TaxID=610380 RepID=E2C6V3_HARSA|nr:hypothetical protein EAI_02734 [Harpegnathos saltator]
MGSTGDPTRGRTVWGRSLAKSIPNRYDQSSHSGRIGHFDVKEEDFAPDDIAHRYSDYEKEKRRRKEEEECSETSSRASRVSNSTSGTHEEMMAEEKALQEQQHLTELPESETRWREWAQYLDQQKEEWGGNRSLGTRQIKRLHEFMDHCKEYMVRLGTSQEICHAKEVRRNQGVLRPMEIRALAAEATLREKETTEELRSSLQNRSEHCSRDKPGLKPDLAVRDARRSCGTQRQAEGPMGHGVGRSENQLDIDVVLPAVPAKPQERYPGGVLAGMDYQTLPNDHQTNGNGQN